MKKIITLFISLFISLFLMMPSVYASNVLTKDRLLNEFNVWENMSLTTYTTRHYVESNLLKINYDHIEIELSTAVFDHEEIFVEHNDVISSRLEIFDSLFQTTPSKSYPLRYETDEVKERLFLFVNGEIAVRTPTVDKGKYMRIVLAYHKESTHTQRENVSFYLNNTSWRNQLDIGVLGYNTFQQVSNINALPETSGNPTNPEGEWGVVTWTYNEIDKSFSALITYQGDYLIKIPSIGFSDNFLDDVHETFYYTLNGERYLYFVYSDEDNLLLTSSNSTSKKWTGYTMWNLSTNELVMTHRAYILTYIYVCDYARGFNLNCDGDRDAYAYFYMPQIEVDELLSVSVTFNYRYGKKDLTTLWQQRYTSWETAAMVLEKDQTSIGNNYPQWVYDTWANAGLVLGVGSILSMIPGTQMIGIPILLAGGIMLNVANVGALNHIFTGHISEIEKWVNPTQTLMSQVKNHYEILAGHPISIGASDPLYRLYLGKFSSVGTNYVEIDNKTFKYIEVVWTTEGEVYSVTKDFIDAPVIIDIDYEDIRPDEDPPIIINLFGEIGQIIYYIFTIFISVSAVLLLYKKNYKRLVFLGVIFLVTSILLGMW